MNAGQAQQTQQNSDGMTQIRDFVAWSGLNEKDPYNLALGEQVLLEVKKLRENQDQAPLQQAFKHYGIDESGFAPVQQQYDELKADITRREEGVKGEAQSLVNKFRKNLIIGGILSIAAGIVTFLYFPRLFKEDSHWRTNAWQKWGSKIFGGLAAAGIVGTATNMITVQPLRKPSEEVMDRERAIAAEQSELDQEFKQLKEQHRVQMAMELAREVLIERFQQHHEMKKANQQEQHTQHHGSQRFDHIEDAIIEDQPGASSNLPAKKSLMEHITAPSGTYQTDIAKQKEEAGKEKVPQH